MENLKRQRWYAPKSREGALPGLERRCYIIRRKYREGGKRGEGRGEMGDEIFFFLIYVGFCRTKSFLVNVL
mgnify:CR=1 FL=1